MSSVAEILAQMAQNAGRSQLQRGAIIGNTIQDVSQVPGQILNDRERQAILDQQRVRLQVQDARAAAQDKRQADADARDQANMLAAQEHEKTVNAGLAAAIGSGGDPSQFDAKAAFAAVSQLGHPEAIRDVIAKHREMLPKLTSGAPGSVMRDESGAIVPGSAIPEKKPDYTINGQRFSGATDQPLGPAVPTQVAPKSIESKSVLLDGKPAIVNFNPATGTHTLPDGTDVSMRVKPIPTQAAVTVQQGQSDAKNIADAIIVGDQPPDVKGLFRLAGPVRSELAKQGYDMTRANLDWEATKKHLATLNGSQQTRLRQAIGTASESLGVIEDLAKQWDGGKFPLLNKAALVAAKQGALGPQAQQIATNLDAQITDVTSELGNVYMGGNSPTDHALGLAQKNLSADWTKEQLLSAIKLARTNLQIRNNSITNAGAVLSTPAPATAPTKGDPLGLFGPKK